MKIDGFYVPDELLASVRAAANSQGEVQYIGVTYRSPEPKPAGGFSWGEALAQNASFFRDLEVGRFCSWVFGPSYDDLKSEGMAAILFVCPEEAK